jgi:hypothetical protein
MSIVRLNTPKYDKSSVEAKRRVNIFLLKILRTLVPTTCRIPILYKATACTKSYNFFALQLINPVSYRGMWNGFKPVQGTKSIVVYPKWFFSDPDPSPTWLFSHNLNTNFTFVFSSCSVSVLGCMLWRDTRFLIEIFFYKKEFIPNTSKKEKIFTLLSRNG